MRQGRFLVSMMLFTMTFPRSAIYSHGILRPSTLGVSILEYVVIWGFKSTYYVYQQLGMTPPLNLINHRMCKKILPGSPGRDVAALGSGRKLVGHLGALAVYVCRCVRTQLRDSG